MLRLVISRVLQSIPMLLLVSLVVFGLLAAAPGDPARKALTIGLSGFHPDERDVEAKRKELGLDRPLPERYARWLGDALRLDLGASYVSRRPVTELLADRLGASAVLALVTLAVSVAIALPLGVLAAVYAGSRLDSAVRLLTLLGASLPGFWLALLAMWLFAAELRWLPALGSFTPRGIVLPAAVLTLRTVGLLVRLMRASMLDALAMEFVAVARAKGLRRRTVVRRHVLPNALMPVLTVIGLDFAALLASAAVIEWVFAWPGIGRLGVDAALAGDVPVVMGFVLVVSLVVVAVNLLVDVSYGLVDPRQRTGAIT
jgi:ABC-type dipeptide/oligopeptide/nickel transport system permease component